MQINIFDIFDVFNDIFFRLYNLKHQKLKILGFKFFSILF